MSGLDWKALADAEVRHDPYDHIHVVQALTPAARAAIPGEFPTIKDAGSYSLADAPPGPALQGVIDDLESERFRALMAQKFGIDLADKPTVITLRGRSGKRDGNIHTDSKTKILTLLLYLNEDWTGPEGELRLLRNDRDLNASAFQAPATMGSLLIFKRTDESWHGHTFYEGRRRVLQFNYLQLERHSLVSRLRHRLSALAKQHA